MYVLSMCRSMNVKVSGKSVDLCFLFLPCGFWESELRPWTVMASAFTRQAISMALSAPYFIIPKWRVYKRGYFKHIMIWYDMIDMIWYDSFPLPPQFYFSFFGQGLSLHSPGWSETCNPLASAFQWACDTTPEWLFFSWKGHICQG